MLKLLGRRVADDVGGDAKFEAVTFLNEVVAGLHAVVRLQDDGLVPGRAIVRFNARSPRRIRREGREV